MIKRYTLIFWDRTEEVDFADWDKIQLANIVIDNQRGIILKNRFGAKYERPKRSFTKITWTQNQDD